MPVRSKNSPPRRPRRPEGTAQEHPDVAVRIVFEGDVHAFGRVSRAMAALDREIRLLQEEELLEAKRALADAELEAPPKADIWHLRRRPAARVESVATGSIEVVVVLTAASYWLLDATLGESVRNAWAESKPGQRSKAFLKKFFDTKIFPRRYSRLKKRLATLEKLGSVHVGQLRADERQQVITMLVKDLNPAPPPVPSKLRPPRPDQQAKG